jgi:hypothetical protein
MKLIISSKDSHLCFAESLLITQNRFEIQNEEKKGLLGSFLKQGIQHFLVKLGGRDMRRNKTLIDLK